MADYVQAQRVLTLIQKEMSQVFNDVEVLITATSTATTTGRRLQRQLADDQPQLYCALQCFRIARHVRPRGLHQLGSAHRNANCGQAL